VLDEMPLHGANSFRHQLSSCHSPRWEPRPSACDVRPLWHDLPV